MLRCNVNDGQGGGRQDSDNLFEHAVSVSREKGVTDMCTNSGTDREPPGRKSRPEVAEKRKHYRRPASPPFTRKQRKHTTILIGGLSFTHDRLAEAALQSLGYVCRALPTPDLNAYEIGKEYQNNGYCNPAYFTVGNLVKHLLELESQGMSREEIVEQHVFVTAGSCGTCRFGMYEEEYQLALRNAGFHGFRILTFGIDQSPDQPEDGAGLEKNFDFYLAIAGALNIADILNQLACQIRPYETQAGSTDEALARVVAMMTDTLRRRAPFEVNSRAERVLSVIRLGRLFKYVGKVMGQLYSRDIVDAMRHIRAEFDAIEIDRFRVRPIVKVIGEFWAQTTDGDGNFKMVRFLEGERAEAYVDRTVGTRLMYSFHMAREMAKAKRGIDPNGDAFTRRNPRAWVAQWIRYYRKLGLLALAEKLYKRENGRLLEALGGTLHEIVDQSTFHRLAAPYYEWRCASGEGHLEIGENIYYQTHDLCHMVLSLKPFGCMPSTQSDGAQAAVLEDYGDLIYLPIETSGDSEILAYSRVQMALDGARAKANREFEAALAETGLCLDELRAYVDEHPELKRPTFVVPAKEGIAGRAALLVRHVSDLVTEGSPGEFRFQFDGDWRKARRHLAQVFLKRV